MELANAPSMSTGVGVRTVVHTLRAAVLVAAAGIAGCDVEGVGAPSPARTDSTAEHPEPMDVDVDERTVQTFERVPADPLASAGWIADDRSIVLPFCPAILVSPKTVLASAACMNDVSLNDSTFGVATPGLGPVWTLASTEPFTERLTRVNLEFDTTPSLTPPSLRELDSGHHRVLVRSFAYVSSGDASWTWNWAGSLRVEAGRGTLAPDPDTESPNCHGEVGAGVFLPSGELVGVISGGRSSGDCVDVLDVELLRMDDFPA